MSEYLFNYVSMIICIWILKCEYDDMHVNIAFYSVMERVGVVNSIYKPHQ